MSSKRVTYLKKTVSFHGQDLIMFSIDGSTWSSRKEELLQIIERHELERQNFGGQIKGGPQVKLKSGQTEDGEVESASPKEEQARSKKMDKATTVKEVAKKQQKSLPEKNKSKPVKQKPTQLKTIAGRKAKAKLPEPKKRTAAKPQKRQSTKSRKKVA